MAAGAAGISLGIPQPTGGPRYDPFLNQWVGGDSGGSSAPAQPAQPARPAAPTPSNGPGGGPEWQPPPMPMPTPSAPAPAAPPPEMPAPEETPTAGPMPASMSAVTTPIPAPGGALNPNLGRRIYPQSMQALVEMAGRNY